MVLKVLMNRMTYLRLIRGFYHRLELEPGTRRGEE